MGFESFPNGKKESNEKEPITVSEIEHVAKILETKLNEQETDIPGDLTDEDANKLREALTKIEAKNDSD